MTQHTDMGGLVERLNQAADDLVSGATIFSDRVYGLLIEAADAIEALSIPQGLGEGLVLVPREPTDAMLEACKPWPSHWPKDGPDFPAMNAACLTDRMAARSDWQRMIEAAPFAAGPSEEQVERAAIAIERADKDRDIPEGTIDHDEVSSWGEHLARAALTSARAQ